MKFEGIKVLNLHHCICGNDWFKLTSYWSQRTIPQSVDCYECTNCGKRYLWKKDLPIIAVDEQLVEYSEEDIWK